MHILSLWPLKHPLLLIPALCRTLMEPDLLVVCLPHPHVGCSNSAPIPWPQPRFKDLHLDTPMDRYKQQQQHDLAFSRRKPVDDGRRTKMRQEKETTENSNYNDSNGTNFNSTSFSLHKQLQPYRGVGGSRGRSPRRGFEPQTDDELYKTNARCPNLSPRRPVNAKKLVNWRLACFMSNEYLTRGTLLGRPWPPQDSNPNWHGISDKSKSKFASLDQDEAESRREKEAMYHTLTDSIRAGDIHFPGIVNPSQLAARLGLE